MGVPKRLTERRREFARLLVTNKGSMTNAQCAVEAGYSEKRAKQEASELQHPIKSPLVVAYIQELREKNFEDNKLAINRILEDFNYLLKSAQPSSSSDEKVLLIFWDLFCKYKLFKAAYISRELFSKLSKLVMLSPLKSMAVAPLTE